MEATISDLLNSLQSVEDKEKIYPIGFGKPNSWRGIYAEVMFPPVENISVMKMIENVNEALEEAFLGYKGGAYQYDLSTPIHVEYDSSCYTCGATALSMLEKYDADLAYAIGIGNPEDDIVIPILLKEMFGWKVGK